MQCMLVIWNTMTSWADIILYLDDLVSFVFNNKSRDYKI